MQIIGPLLIVAAALFVGADRTTDNRKTKVLVACGWALTVFIAVAVLVLAVSHAE